MPDLGSVLGMVTLLGAGLALYLGVLTVWTVRRLRRPARRTYGWAVSKGLAGDPSELDGGGLAFDEWTFSRVGVEFRVWDVQGARGTGPVVIVTHGWGGSRVDMLARLPALAKFSSRVVLWDMRGHGETPGVCKMAALEADDLARLIDRVSEGVAGQRLVLYGYSLGAEVSVRAARLREASVVGLVLESPFRRGITPAWNLLTATGQPRLVNLPLAMGLMGVLDGKGPGWRWADLARLMNQFKGRAIPLLVVHGDQDALCPLDDGRALAEAGRGGLAVIAGAGHADIWLGEGRAEAGERVGAFLNGLGESA